MPTTFIKISFFFWRWHQEVGKFPPGTIQVPHINDIISIKVMVCTDPLLSMNVSEPLEKSNSPHQPEEGTCDTSLPNSSRHFNGFGQTFVIEVLATTVGNHLTRICVPFLWLYLVYLPYRKHCLGQGWASARLGTWDVDVQHAWSIRCQWVDAIFHDQFQALVNSQQSMFGGPAS